MRKGCVRFRIMIVSLTLVVLASSASVAARKAPRAQRPLPPNTLTPTEVKQGFVLLFDGKSLEKFKGATQDEIPKGCWLVEDGQIVCTSGSRRPQGASGSIVTKEQYAAFELRLEYKLDVDFKGHVNGGVKYFAYPGTELGLEYQILDPDYEVEGPHALADLYDLLPAQARPAKPRGQWNEIRIIAQGNQVEHWLNGKKVLTFERGSVPFRQAVAKSKFRKQAKFGEAERGPILLQEHGGGIAFRNIRIKVLDR